MGEGRASRLLIALVSMDGYTTCKGLFTCCDCDFDFLSQQMGPKTYQCQCSHNAIMTMALNPMKPISYDK